MLEAFLFGVTPRDPITLTIASLVLLAVSIVACLIPAIRAARVDPLDRASRGVADWSSDLTQRRRAPQEQALTQQTPSAPGLQALSARAQRP